MDKLRRALSGQDSESQAEEGGFNEIVDTSSLSWSTRIKGFIACFLLGFVFSIFGTILFFFHNTRGFGICYSFGSIVSLLSTMFLMGPFKQLKKMFEGTRVIATAVMLASLVLTLFFALKVGNGGLVLLFVIIQFLAMTWYSLSYIPYARDAVKKCFSGLM
ncbi:unnamed protein product [Orchesella dallaii]|uniref:Vesicle transport protein n=1 Tax=Orchesella dallaii TaxID=48710 RepID=A0ABP1QMH7_9HEXA